MAIAIVIAALLAGALVLLIMTRNGIIRERNACEQAWSGIDVQLKRRHDLVANLAETVKGYALHERLVLARIASARAAAMAARGVAETAQAEQALTHVLGDLRAVAENYPQLRATENFQQLSSSLVGLERELVAARNAYNSGVRSYNTRIQRLPGRVVAKLGDFSPREFFALEDAADREPTAVTLAG